MFSILSVSRIHGRGEGGGVQTTSGDRGGGWGLGVRGRGAAIGCRSWVGAWLTGPYDRQVCFK